MSTDQSNNMSDSNKELNTPVSKSFDGLPDTGLDYATPEQIHNRLDEIIGTTSHKFAMKLLSPAAVTKHFTKIFPGVYPEEISKTVKHDCPFSPKRTLIFSDVGDTEILEKISFCPLCGENIKTVDTNTGVKPLSDRLDVWAKDTGTGSHEIRLEVERTNGSTKIIGSCDVTAENFEEVTKKIHPHATWKNSAALQLAIVELIENNVDELIELQAKFFKEMD